MIPFVRRRDGVHPTLSAGERSVLASLTGQLRQILDGDLRDDPVAARLFPDGYRDDPEAADEFRRYTMDDLQHAKAENARIVHEWLTEGADRPLDGTSEQAWLRCLTDLRLTVAERLGIADGDPDEDDADDPDDEDPMLGLRDVYDWLGYVQEHLVMVLSAGHERHRH